MTATTGIRTFMAELVNPRERHRMVKVYCGVGADCAEAHELDEKGSRWHPPLREQVDTVYDVVEAGTGIVRATEVTELFTCGVPGAMFFTDYTSTAADERQPGSHLFASGQCLCVIVPGPDFWNIDSRAGNCGSPADFDHRCWVRHGEPPVITVDKDGLTCSAGAGSIQVPGGWHGFLRNGELVVA